MLLRPKLRLAWRMTSQLLLERTQVLLQRKLPLLVVLSISRPLQRLRLPGPWLPSSQSLFPLSPKNTLVSITRHSTLVSLIRNIKTSPTVTLTTLTGSPQNSPSRTLTMSRKRSKSGAPTIISVWATIQLSSKLCSVYCLFNLFSLLHCLSLLCSFFFSPSRTLDKYGHGAGGTRNIAGNGAMHLSLEQELANLHRKPAALVFSSCYVANDATLSTLGAKLPGCVFFSDTMNHASMIQGMRHSGAKRVLFKHNDLEDLETKLKQYPKDTPKVIAFESVYSMCGSIGPIKEICDLAEQYGALTFLDEVDLLHFMHILGLVDRCTHRFMLLVYTDPAVRVLPNTWTTMLTLRPVIALIPSKAQSWIV